MIRVRSLLQRSGNKKNSNQEEARVEGYIFSSLGFANYKLGMRDSAERSMRRPIILFPTRNDISNFLFPEKITLPMSLYLA